MEVQYRTSRIGLPDQLFERLASRAGTYNMSTYYFARMLVARYASMRSFGDADHVPVFLSQAEEATSLVTNVCDLQDDDGRCEILTTGFTDEFWRFFTEGSLRYGVSISDFFSYVLLRYLEDEYCPGLSPDLDQAFGLRPAVGGDVMLSMLDSF